MMQRMATYKHVYPENLYDHLVTVLFGGPMVCSRCGSTAFFSFFVFVLFIFWYLAVILLTVGMGDGQTDHTGSDTVVFYNSAKRSKAALRKEGNEAQVENRSNGKQY